MRIELVYFDGCPHVAAARARLRAVLASLGSSAAWTEWETGDASTPEGVRGYSSPTVLVDGVDVEGKAPTSGAGCAVSGGPSLEALRATLTLASR